MQALGCHPTTWESIGSCDRPSIVIGITHPETCLVLPERIRVLKAAGFRVVIISSPGTLLNEIAISEGVDVAPVSMERGVAPLADVASLIRLCRVLKQLQPSMTEFSTPKAGLLGNLAAKLCRIPTRVYLLRGLRLETLSGLKRRLLLSAERIAAASAHHVLCNSKSLRAKALKLGIAPPEKLHVLGGGSSQGVDTERFSPGPEMVRRSLRIPNDCPVIGFVGRLTCDKGIPELLQAFERILQKVPEARLLLVGWFDESDDALSEAVRRHIMTHAQILYTGFVADTAPYYRAMDLMVLPTWREGFPNVVLEAGSTGIPVVATHSTGACDSVLPEVTGLLIPAGYPEAIAEAVIRLIRNPDERFRMGRAAREWVITRFVNEHVLGLTVDFYKKLLQPPNREEAGAVVMDGPAVAD